MNVISINKPIFKAKMAIFDLDYTLIKPIDGKIHYKDETQWKWLNEDVPTILTDYCNKDYAIIVLTHQSNYILVKSILESLKLPITLSQGSAINYTRMLLFNNIFKTKWKDKRNKIDLVNSFYVGDSGGNRGDMSNFDRIFATQLNVTYYYPEQIFYNLSKIFKSMIPHKEYIKDNQEIIIMTGYPGSSKTTFSKTYFENYNYIHIDGDVYKIHSAMVEEGFKHLQNGKSVVFDSINPTKMLRKKFIDIGKQLNIPCRCFHIATSIEDSIRNNKLRALTTKRKVPQFVYASYKKQFQIPTIDEGLTEVVTINP